MVDVVAVLWALCRQHHMAREDSREAARERRTNVEYTLRC